MLAIDTKTADGIVGIVPMKPNGVMWGSGMLKVIDFVPTFIVGIVILQVNGPGHTSKDVLPTLTVGINSTMA